MEDSRGGSGRDGGMSRWGVEWALDGLVYNWRRRVFGRNSGRTLSLGFFDILLMECWILRRELVVVERVVEVVFDVMPLK